MYPCWSFSIITPKEDIFLMSCTVLFQLKYYGKFLKNYLHLEKGYKLWLECTCLLLCRTEIIVRITYLSH